MTTPYLIAHKVRGAAAFDIAERMPCPECKTYEYVGEIIVAESNPGCFECDDAGYWWIIPTSGHRAHPFWEHSVDGLCEEFIVSDMLKSMPPSLPDHYPLRTTAKTPSIISLLGIGNATGPPLRRIT